MITPKFPRILHGGDYNPEQWAEVPGIWEEDRRLMKLAHLNCATIGVFSWASLEPEEGVFTFDWLDEVIDGLWKNGIRFILATPSGGKPNWLGLKYEDVRKRDPQGLREPQHSRHNHCWTSLIYREKVRIINTQLAERYGKHPGLLMWHISNELSGRCYCSLCFAAFHDWLRQRYGTVEKMNAAWWAKFWSHTYTSFEQVTFIDETVHGLDLAWKRFTTDQIVSFVKDEAEPLRRLSPNVPITTNCMGTYPGFDQWKLAEVLDVVSWDSYPNWHAASEGDIALAANTAFTHDLYRSFQGGKPFVLMECTPSQVNWTSVSPLKRPGMHRLASLQAVAHGADAVCYFQFRKSRGSTEKYHGAVVDHAGHENTRVFREVAQLGADLKKLDAIVGATASAEVAVLFDWDNQWAIPQGRMMRNIDKDYVETLVAHYQPFWQRGVGVDVIESVQDFGKYKLIVAPMLHMLRPGVAERIAEFVSAGGVFVATYLSGWVNEEDLCFLGGFPGPLREVLGIWVEETDALPDSRRQTVLPVPANPMRLPSISEARHFCDIMHLEGAEALATYGEEFYAGSPAVTVNRFGQGRAYYVSSRNDAAFHEAMASSLIEDLKLRRAVSSGLPAGVSAQVRIKDGDEFLFLLNFTPTPQTIPLGPGKVHNVLEAADVENQVTLPSYGAAVLKKSNL
jgi:beta-galactosidase